MAADEVLRNQGLMPYVVFEVSNVELCKQNTFLVIINLKLYQKICPFSFAFTHTGNCTINNV